MSFFSKLFKVVKKVAPVAIGYAVGGPAGAAIGGGLGSAARGGNIGQIIQGAATGYGAGSLLGAGTAGLAAAKGVSNLPSMGAGIVPDSAALTGLKAAGGQIFPTATNALSGNFGGTSNILGGLVSGSGGSILGGNPLLSLANLGGSIYSAQAGTKAAQTAANQQAAAADKAIAAQERALTQVRGDLQPFREAGVATAPALTTLVNDPTAQLNFIQNNPFYQSLAKDAKDKLFANQAARGKVGSGGTAEALQNSLLLLGNDLLNQDIQRKQNLTALGANAAAQTGTATQNTAQNVGGYLTDAGTARSAGTMGAFNAQTGAINNALGGLTSLYAIDKGLRV